MPHIHYRSSTAVIFDDHKMFAEIFAMMLEKLNYFAEVKAVSTTEELQLFFSENHDSSVYLFADYFIPGVNILHLISDLRKFYSVEAVIMVTGLNNPTLIRQVLKQVSQVFLTKTSGVSEVISCLIAIRNNKMFLSPAIKALIDSTEKEPAFANFTAKEIEILSFISSGKNISTTAIQLNLSRHTIIAHRRNMMSKVNCNSVGKLLAFALDNGLIKTG